MTSETIRQLREKRKKVNAIKVAKKANKASHSGETHLVAQRRAVSPPSATQATAPGTPVIDTSATPDAVDELSEEIVALEVSEDAIREGSGIVVGGTIRLSGRRLLRGN